MIFNTWLTIFFGIIGSIGTFAALYFERKARKLKKDRFRFSWHDIYQSTKELSKKAIKKYQPEILIAGPGGPSIVANLMLEHQQYFISQIIFPVEDLAGVCCGRKDDLNYYIEPLTDYNVWIPKIVTENKDKNKLKVLIVDDAIFTNQICVAIKSHLIKNGYKPENIKICALVVMSTVMKSKVKPDWVHFQVETPNFFLPWGKI